MLIWDDLRKSLKARPFAPFCLEPAEPRTATGSACVWGNTGDTSHN